MLVSSGVADPVVLVLVVPIPLILYAAFKNAVGRMGDQFEHLGQVNRMYLATIEALAMAIDAKDRSHARSHPARPGVRRGAGAGTRRDRWTTIKAIEAAALLHDTGKLAVPEHILNKPGKLTPAEFEKMKLHVDVGADILSAIDFPYPVVPIVRYHHENWDGSGYPRGSEGAEIPIGARILSVVDCFDALTSDRPYRRALSEEAAFDILKARRATMYDPAIVDTFIRVYRDLRRRQSPLRTTRTRSRRSRVAAGSVASPPASTPEFAAADSDNLLSIITLARLASDQASPADVASLTTTLVRNLVPGATCAFYIRNEEELIMSYAVGPLAPALRWMRIPVNERLTGWVAAHRRTIVNSDAALDLAGLDLPAVPRTCLSTPLLDGETRRRRADAVRGIPHRVHRRTGPGDADARPAPGAARPTHVGDTAAGRLHLRRPAVPSHDRRRASPDCGESVGSVPLSVQSRFAPSSSPDAGRASLLTFIDTSARQSRPTSDLRFSDRTRFS